MTGEMPGALSLSPSLPQPCVCVPVRVHTISWQKEQIREQPLCEVGFQDTVTTGTACRGQADRESHCPHHAVLSLQYFQHRRPSLPISYLSSSPPCHVPLLSIPLSAYVLVSLCVKLWSHKSCFPLSSLTPLVESFYPKHKMITLATPPMFLNI